MRRGVMFLLMGIVGGADVCGEKFNWSAAKKPKKKEEDKPKQAATAGPTTQIRYCSHAGTFSQS